MTLTESERRMKERFRKNLRQWTCIASKPRTAGPFETPMWRPVKNARLKVETAQEYTRRGFLVSACRHTPTTVELLVRASNATLCGE